MSFFQWTFGGPHPFSDTAWYPIVAYLSYYIPITCFNYLSHDMSHHCPHLNLHFFRVIPVWLLKYLNPDDIPIMPSFSWPNPNPCCRLLEPRSCTSATSCWCGETLPGQPLWWRRWRGTCGTTTTSTAGGGQPCGMGHERFELIFESRSSAWRYEACIHISFNRGWLCWLLHFVGWGHSVESLCRLVQGDWWTITSKSDRFTHNQMARHSKYGYFHLLFVFWFDSALVLIIVRIYFIDQNRPEWQCSVT